MIIKPLMSKTTVTKIKITALSALKDPTLPPIDQNSMRFYNRVAVYDDFGGLGFEEESNKMASCIGNNKVMLLANHGILTTGETVADGFNYLYYFEKAAETYLTALSTNQELNVVSHEVAEKTAEEAANFPTDFTNLCPSHPNGAKLRNHLFLPIHQIYGAKETKHQKYLI